MKKWFIALSISLTVCTTGLVYFTFFMAQDGCLDSGGRWLGALNGCDGGNGYSTEYLSSPLAVGIFTGIVLAVSSALIQVQSIYLQSKNKT